MQKRHWIALTGLSLSLTLAGAASVTAQDGTGGPEDATPDPSLCDREVVSEERFTEFVQATPGYFTGTIEPVEAASLAERSPVDDAIAAEIQATLLSYEACVGRDGNIGAYAFLSPSLELVQLVYLGVSTASLTPEVSDATPVGMAPVQPAPNMTPQQIVQLDDGRVGAVVPAPQPGTDLALLVLVNDDGVWLIEDVAPILEAGGSDSDGTSGGGP